MIPGSLKTGSIFFKSEYLYIFVSLKDDFSPATANEERMIALRDE